MKINVIMMKIKLILLLLFTVIFFAEKNLQAQCFGKNTTFQAGEKFTMEIAYEWGFIWVNAGSVYFKVDTSSYGSKPAYHLTSFGRSYDSWDWFYTVRDLYESYVDAEKMRTVYFRRKILEGSKNIHNKYRFDYGKKKIYSDLYHTDYGASIDTISLRSCTFDALTAIYYARNLDFSDAKPGQVFPLYIMIDNKIHDLYIRYQGREVIKDRDKNIYKCIKFTAKMIDGSIFSGGEDVTVWVTDDENKVPVIVEAKIIVGYIKAYLVSYEGLRHPMSALISKKSKD
ncbi:MAG: DUF3108 domain-containing protein [Bacteroidota bacterium]